MYLVEHTDRVISHLFKIQLLHEQKEKVVELNDRKGYGIMDTVSEQREWEKGPPTYKSY